MDLGPEIKRLRASVFPAEKKLAQLLEDLQGKILSMESFDAAKELSAALDGIAIAVRNIKFPEEKEVPNPLPVEIINHQTLIDYAENLKDICNEIDESEAAIVSAIRKLGATQISVVVANATEIGRSVGGIMSMPTGGGNSNGLTDTQLRAAPVPVSGSFSASTTAKATAVAPTYVEGTDSPISQTLGGGLRISGTINASSSAHATAADPTYVEGTDNPLSQDLSGHQRVNVANFPATQPVSGTVGVNNFPADQLVHEANMDVAASTLAKASTQTDGTQKTQVTNFPVSQAVTGPLTDTQLRATAVPVSGTVGVNNFPADQLVHNANIDVASSTLAKALTQTDGTQKTQVTNFPADQLVHAANLDVASSTLAKAATQTDGTQKTQVTNLPATQPISDVALDTNLDAKVSTLAKDATLGGASDTPGAWTVLDQLNKIRQADTLTNQTLAKLLTVLTPPTKPKSTTTLLHR